MTTVLGNRNAPEIRLVVSAALLAITLFACGGSGSANSDAGIGADAYGTPDASRDPAGPIFLSLRTSSAGITEGGSIRIVAVVTDPDGIEDLIGGVLTTPDGNATLGAFVTSSGEEGAYSLELTWNQFDQIDALTFAESTSRDFVVTFFDVAEHASSVAVPIGFYCDNSGHVCGDGACVDTGMDSDHCGDCDTQCPSGGQCAGGECRRTFGVSSSDAPSPMSCSDYCASLSHTCVETCFGDPGSWDNLDGWLTATQYGSFASQSVYESGAPAKSLFSNDCNAVPPTTFSWNGGSATETWDRTVCCCLVQ